MRQTLQESPKEMHPISPAPPISPPPELGNFLEPRGEEIGMISQNHNKTHNLL